MISALLVIKAMRSAGLRYSGRTVDELELFGPPPRRRSTAPDLGIERSVDTIRLRLNDLARLLLARQS